MKVMKKVFSAFKNGEVYEAKQNAEGTLTEVKFAVVRPNQRAQSKGQEFFNKKFGELVRAGTLVSVELEKEAKKRELFVNQKPELEILAKKLTDAETLLLKGGAAGLKKSDGRRIAIQMIKDRAELMKVSAEGSRLNQLSAEGQSENARFNYLIFACTVYEDGPEAGQHYFKSYENFLDSDDIVINLAGQALMDLLYDPIESQKELPEYKFLIKYNFCNSKLQFINPEGKPCDEEYRLVDDTGRYIKVDGSYCDKTGNAVDKEGLPVVESSEFLED